MFGGCFVKKIEPGESLKFEYPENRALYDLIQVSASDIGFHWETELLMSKILYEVAKFTSDEDLLRALHLYDDSGLLEDRVRAHLSEIRKLAEESM